ncbi:hypothetical protein NQD34_017449 [Periophthalmus magnuspinnatus]|nr:hypothetical protein NQD34_017449 [Periophthalmus magnuspinnatus]
MKLWDVLATCLLLLSSVATRPLYSNARPAKRTYFPSSSDSVSISEEDSEEANFQPQQHSLRQIPMEDQNYMRGPYPNHLEDVMDFIEATIGRLRRSSEAGGNSRGRRERQRGAANAGRDREGRSHSDRRRGRSRGRGERRPRGQEQGQDDGGAGTRMSPEGSPPQCDGLRPGIPDQRGADLPLLQRTLCGRRDQLRQDPQQPHTQQEAGQGHALSHLLSANRL